MTNLVVSGYFNKLQCSIVVKLVTINKEIVCENISITGNNLM